MWGAKYGVSFPPSQRGQQLGKGISFLFSADRVKSNPTAPPQIKSFGEKINTNYNHPAFCADVKVSEAAECDILKRDNRFSFAVIPKGVRDRE